MATFVLVHGAWHGGWCWRRVAQALRAGGDEVFAPTLTGLGERAHLLSPAIGLDTHVDDVLGVLESEDLSDVVLVGHSYAGLVVSAASDRAPRRVARVVYLDAAVAADGQCLIDRLGERSRTLFEERSLAEGEGWRLPASVATAAYLSLEREEDIRWVLPRLTDHPMRTMRDPLRLSSAFPRHPRSYLNCIGDRPPGQPRSPQAEGIPDYQELRTGHDAMVTAPDEVVALLRRIARGGA
jgi:pimeloyl-ACP methyl ester carboxylesterase